MKNKQRLYIDVSRLVLADMGSGIPRVARALLSKLLYMHTSEYEIYPVYAKSDQIGYWQANCFMRERFGIQGLPEKDTPISYSYSDIFLGSVDSPRGRLAEQQPFLNKMKTHGVLIYTFVYDLLPILNPDFFVSKNSYDDILLRDTKYSNAKHEILFQKWLHTLSIYDGAICISNTTAKSLKKWFEKYHPEKLSFFKISWIHLSGELMGSIPSYGLPEDAEEVFSWMHQRPTFLIVSTLEPRKGHAQSLAAFEQLWNFGTDINLLIVGSPGWGLEKVTQDIVRLMQKESRLKWLCGISDEYLEKLYQNCTVTLMPSEGEGFGLPVAEAAWYGCPLLLRDIPVFRELADGHATFFTGLAPSELAAAIANWLYLNTQGKIPSTEGMKLLTWRESAQMLLEKLSL